MTFSNQFQTKRDPPQTSDTDSNHDALLLRVPGRLPTGFES